VVASSKKTIIVTNMIPSSICVLFAREIETEADAEADADAETQSNQMDKTDKTNMY